jgi:hypothetical protein
MLGSVLSRWCVRKYCGNTCEGETESLIQLWSAVVAAVVNNDPSVADCGPLHWRKSLLQNLSAVVLAGAQVIHRQ